VRIKGRKFFSSAADNVVPAGTLTPETCEETREFKTRGRNTRRRRGSGAKADRIEIDAVEKADPLNLPALLSP